jgi:transcription-repair coupling factor (superfamily II helicase)
VVLTYRNRKRAKELVDRSSGRLKLVDEKSVYLRPVVGEDRPEALFPLLQSLLRSRGETV